MYRLVLCVSSGSASLWNGAVQLWNSKEDTTDEFQALFDDNLTPGDMNDVLSYLNENQIVAQAENVSIKIQ